MAYQYRNLIERDGQAEALQAECNQILEKRQYPAPTLYMKDEGTPSAVHGLKKVLGTRAGEGLDESGLADTGRAIDQHDPDGILAACL